MHVNKFFLILIRNFNNHLSKLQSRYMIPPYIHIFQLMRICAILITLPLILIFVSAKISACPLELPVAAISIKGHPLEVELASTPEARACGLSNRIKLPENHGMLFIYPTLGPRTFWMKDTHIPLSLAFLNDSGLILSIRQMAPMQTEPRYR